METESQSQVLVGGGMLWAAGCSWLRVVAKGQLVVSFWVVGEGKVLMK